jgi:hypothetical protein
MLTPIRARGALAAIALPIVLLMSGSSAVLAQDSSGAPAELAVPGETAATAALVAAPGSDPLGVSYGEWADRWWTWVTAVPAAQNPLMTDQCQAGQETGGDVFFLPHTAPGQTVTADCVVGAGQSILAQAGSIIWTNDEGETFEEMVPLVEGERDSFSELSVTIDGAEVPDIDSYWVVSPGTSHTFGEDNVFGYDPGTQMDAVVGGWFVMIPPLGPGSHTVVLRDAVDMGDGSEPQVAEYTANVTVESAE